MVLMTMIARVFDGLPLAASVQEDEQTGKYVMFLFITITLTTNIIDFHLWSIHFIDKKFCIKEAFMSTKSADNEKLNFNPKFTFLIMFIFQKHSRVPEPSQKII